MVYWLSAAVSWSKLSSDAPGLLLVVVVPVVRVVVVVLVVVVFSRGPLSVFWDLR